VKRFILEILLAVMLVVTSADLLYLYFDGAWYDPNRGIEVSELVCLGILICLGIYYLVYRIRSIRKLGGLVSD